MMKFLRSQSQTVLVLILIVIGVSFLFYGNVGNNMLSSGGRGNDFGRIAGQDLSVAELYDAVRTTRDMMVIFGQADELNQPNGRAALAEEAWRERLLLYEADRLHIQITDQEVIDFIQHQPIFQKDGAFSPELYQQQMTMLQTHAKITPDAFEQAIRTRQVIQAVKSALFSTVRSSATDVAGEYEKYYGPAQVSYVVIDPKELASSVTVSPAEIEAEYKAHPDEADYRTAEKRKVDYVLLPLTADQMKLADKDKQAAIEALGEKALDFALAFQPDPTNPGTKPATAPDFSAEAKKRGFTPVTTDYFTADTPPAGLPPSPAFNNTAFALTKDNPVSKVIELDNGVAVMQLDDIQASQLKPLDEVRGAIVAKLQQQKAKDAATALAQKDQQAIQAELGKGTDFKTAAEKLKLNVQTMSGVVPAKETQADERTQMIAYATIKLKAGELSQPVPMGDSTVLVLHVDSRGKADPAGEAEFAQRFRARQDEELQNLVYADWAEWMSHQPGTHKPPDLEQFGGVE